MRPYPEDGMSVADTRLIRCAGDRACEAAPTIVEKEAEMQMALWLKYEEQLAHQLAAER